MPSARTPRMEGPIVAMTYSGGGEYVTSACKKVQSRVPSGAPVSGEVSSSISNSRGRNFLFTRGGGSILDEIATLEMRTVYTPGPFAYRRMMTAKYARGARLIAQ